VADQTGGSVRAISFMENEIEESAWGYRRYRIGQNVSGVEPGRARSSTDPEAP
jgi:hypothetical protein